MCSSRTGFPRLPVSWKEGAIPRLNKVFVNWVRHKDPWLMLNTIVERMENSIGDVLTSSSRGGLSDATA